MGEMKNAYKTVVRKPEGKRPLGRSRHIWEDNSLFIYFMLTFHKSLSVSK
jgi:hypothetical protein